MTFPVDLLETLVAARSVAVLTGAGVSKESGIPTFREAQTGLWAQYDPMQLATPAAFLRDPALVWNWYQWRRDLVAKCEPNAGHQALVEIEGMFEVVSLIKQNVEGFHRRASSHKVIEVHGNIMRSKRFSDNVLVEAWDESDEVPPRCPATGDMLRPDVVWFGESLPAGSLEQAIAAAANCDVFFSLGTSGEVQPAASLPLQAVRGGGILVEINPQETPISRHAQYVLNGPSGAVLPELVRALRNGD